MAGIICVKNGIQLSLHVSMVCSTQYFTGLVVEVSNKGGKGTGTGMRSPISVLGSRNRRGGLGMPTKALPPYGPHSHNFRRQGGRSRIVRRYFCVELSRC